jgi:hypothetical protein
MPNVNPGAPVIAPGVVTPANQNKYPQYGVGGGTPGQAAGWKVVTADNEKQKLAYLGQGYVAWFSDKASASQYMQSEQSPVASGSPPALSGLAAIGDFFSRLTQANTWLRVAEGALGIILIAIGLARLTHAVPVATQIAKTAGAVL